MTKWRLGIGFAIAVIVAVALMGVIDNDDSRSGARESEPERVHVVIDSSLTAGGRFPVRYAIRGNGDDQALRPSVALVLWHGGQARNTLLAAGNPRIQPAEGAAIPAVELRGPGPFEFALPKGLRSGKYTLCGYVGVEGSGGAEPFCRHVRVRP